MAEQQFGGTYAPHARLFPGCSSVPVIWLSRYPYLIVTIRGEPVNLAEALVGLNEGDLHEPPLKIGQDFSDKFARPKTNKSVGRYFVVMVI